MNNVENPEISVVITNYNYGQYLEQAIQSVLKQTYEHLKLIVIDDASTDDSGKILSKYKKQATIIQHTDNKGIVYARNEALELVSSPFILFLDADDWLNEDYLEMLLASAQDNKLDVAYCGMQYYAGSEKGMNWIPPKYSLERLKNENYVHSASLLRKSALAGVRFDSNMEGLTHEDWDFFLNLALRGAKFSKVDGVSLNYRFKSNGRNITNRDKDEKFANLYQYVYTKYTNAYPEEIGYLAYHRFVESFFRSNERLAIAEKQLSDAQRESNDLQARLNTVINSKAYKIGALASLPYRALKMTLRRIRTIRLKQKLQVLIRKSKLYTSMAQTKYESRNKNAKSESYFIASEGNFKKKSEHAIILHLYYTESWEKIFRDKFKILTDKLNLDLYITMPEANIKFIDAVRKDFKDANVFIVPNKGRDVLPFIKVASELESMGYKKVLKVHSKKSTHRDIEGNAAQSGDAWLTTMMDALIPRNDRVLNALIDKINDEKTGMIGALEYTYPLKMYLSNSRTLVERIFNTIDVNFFNGDIANKLNNFSFFGGTMFWVDLKSIRETFNISARNFQDEKGQIDGTTAHALERVFCALLQVQNKAVYTVSPNEVSKLKSENGKYPDWYYEDISGGKPPISVIVPVYADWVSLSKNIASLKNEVGNSEDISVYYVNDCGPEADELEGKITSSISGLTNFYYFRNEQNLGFVKNCNNAALELVNQRNDVLLLNSDTKVTKNFIVEMRRVLYSEPTIAAVTSRSNNATIWSVPMTSRLANYRLASYLLYRLIRGSLPEKYITPTIHGFCVLIRREVINEYGLFDEVYGKGYGEENDFAMRVRQHGWRCAVANRSFVFHYESRSFGNVVRNQQIEKNEKILTKRYPNYRQLVQEYWDSIKEPLK